MAYENFGYGDPNGPQPDYYSPYPMGSEGYGPVPMGWDADQHRIQAGIADAIWRDQQMRAQASAAANAEDTTAYVPPIQPSTFGTSVPPSAIHEPDAQPSRPYQVSRERPFGSHDAHDQPAERSHAKEEDIFEDPNYLIQPREVRKPGHGPLKAACAILIGLGAIAGASHVLDSQEKPKDTSVSSMDSLLTSCDVSGIDEQGGIGTIEFSTSVGDQIVQVIAHNAAGTPVLLNNATRSGNGVTTYTYNTNGLHDKKLTVRAGTTDCTGSFNLGSPNQGDETFVPN